MKQGAKIKNSAIARLAGGYVLFEVLLLWRAHGLWQGISANMAAIVVIGHHSVLLVSDIFLLTTLLEVLCC